MVTTQLHIALAWCQRISGVFHPIPEAPSILIPHLETSVFPNLRAYLSDTQSTLVLETSHIPPLQRAGDFHLVDIVLECEHLKPRQIRLINYCRLFLQVHTIADRGTYVDLVSSKVDRVISLARDLEIHQERPNNQEAWVAWRKASCLWCNVRLGALHQSLGRWKFPSASLRRSWPYQ
jgi:hypothetical protein